MRVLKDGVGKIMTDSGSVSLDKGSIHFLKRYANVLRLWCSMFAFSLLFMSHSLLTVFYRSDVEQFVREGLVEHVMHDGQC